MDFELAPEQREYRDVVIAFARRELNDEVLRRDPAGAFPGTAWKKCAHFGI